MRWRDYQAANHSTSVDLVIRHYSFPIELSQKLAYPTATHMPRFLLLSILLAALALTSTAAEKAAPKPERWEKTIVGFETADKTNAPPKQAILLVGGSNARRWTDVGDYFPGQKVINRGFGGAHLTDVVHFSDRIVLPYAPKIIFVNAGGNDLASGKSPEQIRDAGKAFAAKVTASLPDVRIYYISIPPVMRAASTPDGLTGIKRTNELMQELAHANPRLGFINLFPAFLDAQGKPMPELFVADGTHFSPKGCEVVAKLMREAAGL
jgi:lysophospholipase L1-like esterase